jgi:Skp family chaperone for outer membrane proteins
MVGKHILLSVNNFSGTVFNKASLGMKKHFLVLLMLTAVCLTANAQSRGVKIGFIDMEYILQNVPDYAEAKNQLELKAQKWKQEIEAKRTEINKLKEDLKTERVLLTKELLEEREEEIAFQENELSEYQQKRFGPTGDLMTQKSVLVKPIQDQVFTAAQDIAEAQRYDFIFDKSSDLTMLFAAKRFDISDRVVRAITRSSKRDQLSKKQLKEEEAREAKEDMIDENPEVAERQKVLDEKKAAREKLIEDRKIAAEEKKKAAAEKRQKLLDDRAAQKNGGSTTTQTTEEKSSEADDKTAEPEGGAKTTTANEAEDARAKAAADKAQKLAERKKALEDRRKEILDEREAAKKAKENNTDSKQ